MNKNEPLAVAPEPILGRPKYHHVAFSVKDVDVSVKWYAEKLGFKERWRLDFNGKPWVALIEAGKVMIELMSKPDSVANPDAWTPYYGAAHIRGYAHLSFQVEDAHATMRALAERGVTVARHVDMEPGVKAMGGDGKGAWIWDIDGNLLQIMSGAIPVGRNNISTPG